MDLKSGNLYWPRRTRPLTARRVLLQDVHCDVVVIGAGLTGTLIAYTLARQGLAVVILDKRNAGQGSTSASTALVLYEIDMPLVELSRKRGATIATRCYRSCLEAMTSLRRLVNELGDACEFRRRSSLYLASQPRHLQKLEAEFRARRNIGLDVQFLTASDIASRFSFSAPGAIHSADAAEINPLLLTRRLIHGAQRHGARVFVHTTSAGIRESAQGVIVRTTSGHRVRAKWGIVATGYETLGRAARRVLALKSSYVLVTRPVSRFTGWPGRCLIWETARPYVYLRTTADGRIMIGGGDEDIADPARRDRLLPQKARLLGAKLHDLFPDIAARPAYRWAGTFGESKDGLPYIGSVQPGSRILHALCYGANGTNFAVMAAEILRDRILQRPNPDANLFSFDR